jgi:hypothetical protein
MCVRARDFLLAFTMGAIRRRATPLTAAAVSCLAINSFPIYCGLQSRLVADLLIYPCGNSLTKLMEAIDWPKIELTARIAQIDKTVVEHLYKKCARCVEVDNK